MVAREFLPWLLPQPEGFRRLCAEADARSGDRGNDLRALASHALDINGMHRLASSVSAAVAAKAERPLTPLKLGLISNATTDYLITALVASAARYGLALTVVAAPFGVTAQAALDPGSEIVTAKPDVILMALDYRSAFSDHSLANSPEDQVDAAIGEVAAMIEGFSSACSASIIVQTVAPPPERLFGSFDRCQPGTLAWLIAKFNDRLCDTVVGPGVSLLDVQAIATSVGLNAWYDRAQWMTARLPFSQRMLPLYGEHVARLLGAIRGKSRKVLVLDLDNTIWGGVVGDDGVEGLRLGQGDPVGEAFLDVQCAALALKKRGVLLALCSKNEEAIARKAIASHSACVLREKDFAAVQINWNDKASNLEAIAEELSLGLDSFVFFDDNPAEREQVRAALPQVCVPELPSDPVHYARILLTSGFFEGAAFSSEDRIRADQYAANSERQALRARSRDLTSFLESLQMSATFIANGADGWQRFAQLINKSNQFNLTTRRYTEAEILSLVRDPGIFTLQVRLTDRFGDNGMISAIICRPDDEGDWDIDTWVMSCRVLNRKVEATVLNEIVRCAGEAKVGKVWGSYRRTDRNRLVCDHYRKLGFSPVDQTDDTERFVLDVTSYRPIPVPIVTNR
jgi:FkbH-like protein